jgi:hypothetical protein
MVHGFLAKGVAVALIWQNTMLPHQTLAKILCIIWDEIIANVWGNQNEILHHQANHLNTLKSKTLGTRPLHWFLLHKLDALSYNDQFLVDYAHTDIEGKSHDVFHALVFHLEVAHRAYLQ